MRSNALFLVLLAAAGGAHAQSGCLTLGNTPITQVNFETTLKPFIVDNCGNACHVGGPTPVELNDGNVPLIVELYAYLEPTRPNQSYLFHKVSCTNPGDGTQRMPPAGALNAATRALFYDWIAQGARGLDESGNPFSEIVFRSGLESTRID